MSTNYTAGGGSPARSASEGQLRESEERYRSIFNATTVSIWEEDLSEVKAAIEAVLASGVSDLRVYLAAHPQFIEQATRQVRILDVNEATLQMFGAKDKSSLLGSLERVFTAETRAVFAEELLAIAEGRRFFQSETIVRTLQGERRDVLVSMALPPREDRFERVLVTLTDVTEREMVSRVGKMLAGETDLGRAVQAVTDAATEVAGAKFGAFFYNVLNEAGESYYLYTLSGAPREAFERFGMPRNTAVFAPTFEGKGIIRSPDITADPRYGRNAPHRGMPKGHLPVRSYLAVPVMGSSGEVLGGLFFGHPEPNVFTDRAERLVAGIASQAAAAIENARLHEQRARLIAELKDADRRKDEFLATLSHELRNPLAPIRNAVALLQRAEGNRDLRRQAEEMLARQVGHLVRLVDDLLDIARISRDSIELRREETDLVGIVQGAIETAEPLLAGARHELKVALPAAPLVVDADPVRVAQVVSNLLNNAAKYTAPGGSIDLRVFAEGAWACIVVEDNGMGIAAEDLPRVFDLFSRGKAAASDAQGGLGIGLALARRLTEMHGGSIHAASAGAGKGSEFTVRLPLVPAASRKAVRPESGTKRMPAGRRILVVDDNEDAAITLGALLKLLGAEVRIVNDGPAALATFEAFGPEVVLLDLGMPGMDGFEVARQLRALPNGHASVIAALTGWGQAQDRVRAREAGFDHHLVKPVELSALESVLAS